MCLEYSFSPLKDDELHTMLSLQQLNRVQLLSPKLKQITPRLLKFISTEGNTYYAEAQSNVIIEVPISLQQKLINDNLQVIAYLLSKNSDCLLSSKDIISMSKNEMKQKWNSLKREEKNVRRNGIRVSESSTGKDFAFQNSQYSVPWSSSEEFISEIENDCSCFAIAKIKPEHKDMIVEIKTIPSVITTEEQENLLISFDAYSSIQSEEIWKNITQKIASYYTNKEIECQNKPL